MSCFYVVNAMWFYYWEKGGVALLMSDDNKKDAWKRLDWISEYAENNMISVSRCDLDLDIGKESLGKGYYLLKKKDFRNDSFYIQTK